MKTILEQQKHFFESQKTKDINYRIDKLKKLRQTIKNNINQIVEALYEDFNKPEFETLTSEIGVVMDELNLHIKKLKKWSRPKRVFPHIANFISQDKIYREPYGNVLIISPWNYPFNLSIMPLIAAVSGGNTVVLKPSEYSPNTARVIKKILSVVFEPSYVNIVEGGADVARKLLDLKWDYIFFTGSPAIGKYVYQTASKYLTPVTLELGGKSPVIVDKTADLKITARRIVWGKFLNAGQTCIAPDYVLVDERIKDKFLESLKTEIVNFYGSDMQNISDFTSVINRRNFKRLLSLLNNQNIVFGGVYDEKTNYISPTIVLNPKMNDDIMQTEIFGPLLPVLTYENTEEIDRIISQNPEPLAFYIFSKDKKFQKFLIEKYKFGGAVINDVIVHFVNPRLPFGGVGNSGFGKYHGKFSFQTFTREKPVVKRTFYPDISIRYLPVTKLKERIIKFIFGI